MEIDPRFLMLIAIVAVILLLLFGPGRRNIGPDLRKTCRNCGAAHPSFARFCRRCGKRI